MIKIDKRETQKQTNKQTNKKTTTTTKNKQKQKITRRGRSYNERTFF